MAPDGTPCRTHDTTVIDRTHQAYAGGSMEVQMSAIRGEESDDINNLIAARYDMLVTPIVARSHLVSPGHSLNSEVLALKYESRILGQ